MKAFPKHIDAVLFDLDNTLYPASNGLLHTLDSRIIRYMCELLQIDEQEATAIRRGYLENYGTTLHGLQHHHKVDREHFMSYIHDIAIESFLDSDAELEHLLRQVQAPLAIFTNSPIEHAERILQRLGIRQLFSYVFDIRWQEFLPKPHPQGYTRILERMQARPQRTIFVEDTLRNLLPARALGMYTIFLTDTPTQALQQEVDALVPDVLAAIRHMLRGQGSGVGDQG